MIAGHHEKHFENYIVSKLEQYDYQGAAAIGVVMLIISLGILFLVNLIQWWSGRRTGHVLAS